MIIFIVFILQWNARSLLSNGQDFKQFIDNKNVKPDIMCIQETWLKPRFDFVLNNYVVIRRDREQRSGGGCATFIRKGVPYRVLGTGKEQEYVVVEVWADKKKIVIINYYNPCKQLEVKDMEVIEGQDRDNVIWCGDFNAHNTLWGGDKTDNNGQVIEEIMNDRNLVCMNDGRKTRTDIRSGKESVLDLTFLSGRLALKCEWEVYEESTFGSDHYPIICKLNVEVRLSTEDRYGRWIFNKADWERFMETSDLYFRSGQETIDVESYEIEVRQSIYMAAIATIPKSSGKLVRKAVPWWCSKCKEVVKERNRAFRRLKRTHNFQHMIEYKQAQAEVRRTIRQRKRMYWREYCSNIGSNININDVWGMIKKMEGNRREWNYPILSDGEQLAISNFEKAEMMVSNLSKVHSSSNLSEEERRGREETRRVYTENIQKKGKSDDKYNVPFTMRELRNALDKCKNSAPGHDEISYNMLRHLSNKGIQKVLNLFNKVWEEGKIPTGWKEAVILPIRKPGKDASNPANYRPIALTSHLGKLMERLVNGRLMHFIEERGLMASCQSGFRKGRSTIDSIICLEDEIRKAQLKKEFVVAVFIDVEKAYDMLWVEGLLIKMHMLGIGGNMFNWVMDFLDNRSIQVKIGGAISSRCFVENGTPQGSVISPLLFNIMINDVFSNVQSGIGKSLFADDGSLWKRGKNVKYTMKKVQEALTSVEDWGRKWGFRFSIEKTK